MNEKASLFREEILDESRIQDLKLAASKIPVGHERRSFQAEMALKYLGGNPRRTEEVFGWSRDAVEVGLHEKRTGIVCLSARKGRCGDKLWEDKHSEAAEALMEIAESYAQQDPTFRTTVAYTRLTAAEALKQLSERGFPESSLPSPRCMADVLNRNGHRLRPVVKAKPQKKVEGTNNQFMNIKNNDENRKNDETVRRLSMDCKASVKIGEYSRGGKTRGDNRAVDHDMGCDEKYTPFGLVDEDDGRLHIIFGSSAKTSDFIVDGLLNWYDGLPDEEKGTMSLLQIKADNGPESNGRRTRFLERMVEFADYIQTPVHLLYYPPYHSKYNPIERCWGILEKHWNGTLLKNVETMLGWAKSMTWKGLHPFVNLCRKEYRKGISLSKKAMEKVELRLERNPLLPKWDILIQPQRLR